MAKENKIQISQTLKNMITIIVLACVFFFIGRLWPNNNNSTQISNDLLTQQLQSISELATVEYKYTNMGKFENQATFYGWNVPFTTKSFIISYDGKIKAGIDMSLIDIRISRRTINITVPKSKILTHEIDEKSLEVFDETHNIFNPIQISDYNEFSVDQKEKMEKNVLEKGLLEEAQDKAESTIKKFITSSYPQDNFKINIKVDENLK